MGLEGMVRNNILRPIHDLVLKTEEREGYKDKLIKRSEDPTNHQTEEKEGYRDSLIKRFEDPTDHFVGIADLRRGQD